MPIIRIPAPLRAYTAGNSEVTVNGRIVSEAIDSLISQFPSIEPHLYNNDGELRPYVNFFLGEDNIRDLQGLLTPVKEDDRLLLIPSIAGGR